MGRRYSIRDGLMRNPFSAVPDWALMVGQRAHRAFARFNCLIQPAATQSPESGHLRSVSEVKRWARSRQTALQQKYLYSITSSARAANLSRNGEVERLRCFEINDEINFVGCMTGRSAGFSPFSAVEKQVARNDNSVSPAA
jgi:hypothetical protein